MRVPLEVRYRNVVRTELLEELIKEKSRKLEQVCDDLVSCRVAVESPVKAQQRDRPFRVRIMVRVPPGHEVVVTRESSPEHLDEPVDSVIRTAFDGARLQVRELMDRQRQVTHPPEPLNTRDDSDEETGTTP